MDTDMAAGRWHHRIWVSDGLLDDFERYWHAVDAFPTTELWPLLIPLDRREPIDGPHWFDHRPGPAPTPRELDDVNASEVLAQAWPGPCCSPECLAPLSEHFPGLVRRSRSAGTTRAHGQLIWDAMNICEGIAVRMGLVHTDRPADIPALIGWAGAGSHFHGAGDVTAVLRSWEDRFGARLFFLGGDQMMLSVPAAPTTAFRAVGVAAEHRAFCPDAFLRAPVPFADVAAGLVDESIWTFYWDDSSGHLGVAAHAS